MQLAALALFLNYMAVRKYARAGAELYAALTR